MAKTKPVDLTRASREEIEELWRERVAEIERLHLEMDQFITAHAATAKFKAGDKVYVAMPKFTGTLEEPKTEAELVPGEVRGVENYHRTIYGFHPAYDRELVMRYNVAKVTKSGKAHKNHNIGCSGGIEEARLKLRED